MSSTKKVKSAGRFEARYGVGIRRRLIKVEQRQHSPMFCPFCGFARVHREAPGIFQCQKCESVFSGGAYFPQTLTGSIVQKMVTQKSFLPAVTELLAATEKQHAQTKPLPAQTAEEP